MSCVITVTRSVKAGLSGALFFLATGVHPAYAQEMTAGLIMEKMEPKERYAYVSGIVRGMAYARFRKDTIAGGAKDERGMTCIYDWYYRGEGKTYAMLETTFRKNGQYAPTVIIASLLKKECGE